MRLPKTRLAMLGVLVCLVLGLSVSPADASSPSITITVNRAKVATVFTGSTVTLSVHASGLNVGDQVAVWAVNALGEAKLVQHPCTVVHEVVNGGCVLTYRTNTVGTIRFITRAYRKGQHKPFYQGPTVRAKFVAKAAPPPASTTTTTAPTPLTLTLTVNTASVSTVLEAGGATTVKGVFGPNNVIPSQVAPGSALDSTISLNGPLPANSYLDLYDGQTLLCRTATGNSCTASPIEANVAYNGITGSIVYTTTSGATTGSTTLAISASPDPLCSNPPGGYASDHGGTCPT